MPTGCKLVAVRECGSSGSVIAAAYQILRDSRFRIADPSEKQNLAAGNADKVTGLKTAFDNRIATMVDPIIGGKQTANTAKPTAEKQASTGPAREPHPRWITGS